MYIRICFTHEKETPHTTDITDIHVQWIDVLVYILRYILLGRKYFSYHLIVNDR